MDCVVSPGFGGSGEAHWQTLWQRAELGFRRIEPASWVKPGLADWLAATDAAIAKCPEPPVLLAHSLGCLLVAHWAACSDASRVAAAMLVAVPDPSSPLFPPEAAAFATPPSGALPFPARVVASSDDPFSSLDAVERQAAAWGAGVIIAGALGHINSDSRLGPWAAGRSLLDDLVASALLRGAGSLPASVAAKAPAGRDRAIEARYGPP